MKKALLILITLVAVVLLLPFVVGLVDASRKAPELRKEHERLVATQIYAAEMKAESESSRPSLAGIDQIKERFETRMAAIDHEQ
jgi:hypothetical protein